MDYQRFSDLLPGLFHDWGLTAARPRSDRFAAVLQRVRGMTSPGVLQLLNLALACLEDGETYLEVGSFQGATLVGALVDQPLCRAHAVDNFSEFDLYGENRAALARNLEAFGLTSQVEFFGGDFEEFLLTARSQPGTVGVYLYDGSHDYRSQLMGLLLAVPLLSSRALVVVDDSNFPAVKQATWDFMAMRPEAHLLLDLPTPGNCHGSFWNGLHVLAWDRERRNGYDWNRFRAQRQSLLLESLDLLQQFALSRQGDKVQVIRIG